jgi:hypothetical protein
MSDVVIYDAPATPKDFLAAAPAAMIEKATMVANTLRDVIDKNGWEQTLYGNKYLPVEAWNAMGSMLGIQSREKSITENPDGSFEAHVELINVATGGVIGGGSGYVGADERSWMSKPKSARRSFAITRATGKAYRSNFSWVIKLAGYSPTPAEEMDFVAPPEKKAKKAKKAEKSEKAAPAEDKVRFVTEQEIKNLGTYARTKGWTKEQVLEICSKAFGVTSFNKLSPVDYDSLVLTINTKRYDEALASLLEFTDDEPSTSQVGTIEELHY